ncbi:hypothetical protein JOF56_000734 [Kibdelosporangium banguiense]|uniref:Uncharacterized protein n=1 Tax=Kibdelosporangium banguiense TaxID=1365924 RepID=A0ABS4T8U0_9PSEU|nr:hypothetical protein [Kibdelosporangium banguiense]MBP2320349.1 hypothetical protein [Kibdelosporangium banguiense]
MLESTDRTEKRTLAADRFNLVGEDHAESKPRRDLERQFCEAKTNSKNYWTEAAFLDPHEEGQTAPEGDSSADLMEYRAMHGVGLLLVQFEKLGDEAVTVSTTPSVSAVSAVGVFAEKVKLIVPLRDRIDRSWRESTPEVTQAVRTVCDNVVRVCQVYLDAVQGTSSPGLQLQATRKFANDRSAIRDLLPNLAKLAGANLKGEHERDARQLESYMRLQRSRFMGFGANQASGARTRGVWKVGNGHIDDLVSGRANVGTRFLNIVSQQDFNDELKAWLKK